MSSTLHRAYRRMVRSAGWFGAATLMVSCGGGDSGSVATASGPQKSATSVPAPTTFFPNVAIPADAGAKGMWSPVYAWPGVAVHTVILSDGRLLTFGSNMTTGQQGAINGYDIWDPTVAPDQGHMALPNATGTDIFCSSTVLLAPESPGSTGRVFIAGGDVWTGTNTTNTPNQNTTVLDVSTNGLTRKNDMQRPRWYSTSTTLINGEVYIQGGVSGTDRPEVRSLTGSFRLLSGADTSTLNYSFPRNFVAPDGRVFGFDTNGSMYYVNATGNGSISFAGTLPTQFASDSGSAAMFRPGRILQLGGNSNGVAVIDITGSSPTVTATQSLSSQRQWVNATLLADGQVLATSGSQVRDQPIGVNTKAEIWNPVTGQWLQGPAAAKPRLYHSNAILLPDASVLVTAGGATTADGSPGPADNLNAEIYYPPYFFTTAGARASRPIIASAPDWVDIGRVIPITVENATSVSRVTLVKTGASTHSFNMDQRFVELTFTGSGTSITAQAPARATDATPGYYMLFVFDQAGVPSVSKIVRVGIAAVPNPSVTPTMTNPGAQTTDVGTAVSLTLSASDPNGDTLTFAATGLPSGLTIDPATGVIGGTPTAAGTYSTTVSASDGVNFTTATFTWTVNAVNGVVLDPLPPVASTTAGTTTTFTATSTGGTNVRYSWNFGDGTADTPWSNQATVSHGFSSPGTYNVTVSATDDSGIIRTRSFLQTVSLPSTANKPAASSNILFQRPPSGNARVWVVNQDNDSVSVFDAVTRSKLVELTVGTAPRSIAQAPNGYVWVTNKRSDSISVIDPATFGIVATIALPRASQPFGLVFSPTAAQAFVALEATGQLLKLDAASYATLGSLNVGANPRQLSINADGSSVYVSRFITPLLPGESGATVTPTPSNGAEVVVVSAGGMSFMRTIVLQHSDKTDQENQGRGIPNYLGAATISPDGTQAWVPSKQDNVKRGALRDGLPLNFQNTVRAISSRIVLSSNQEDLSKRVDHDNSSVASAAVYDSKGVYLFVALETSREVAVLDAHRGFQVMRFDVGRAPQGLALSADGNTLYVNNFMDRTVGVYDLQPLLTTGQLTVPLAATMTSVAVEKLPSTVLIGKQFFYDARDPRLARDRYMSCASCHNDGAGDGRVWDLTSMGEGLRNTIQLRGRAGAHGILHWSANFDEVQDFEGQIRALAGGTGLMADVSFNAGTRSRPLGDPKAGVSGDLDALAAYVGSLATFSPSPYRTSAGALSTSGAAGRAVFIAQGCSTCHGGTAFSNSGLMGTQNIGTIKPTSGNRLGGPLSGIDIPTLRDVWATAPYLHDGSAATLEAAVLAHNTVTISAGDLTDLVQYLREVGSEESSAPGPQFSGMIAGLAMDDGAGTIATDQAGNAHTGTLLNGTAWTTAGKYGAAAVSYDGVDDSMTLASPSSIDLGSGSFTVEMWVKRNSLSMAVQRHLFSKCHISAWESGCKELYIYDNQLKFGSYATGDTVSATIGDTNWHHIALVFTRSTNTVQIYVDGTVRTTATKNLEADGTNHVVMVGNLHNDNPFSGLIDEVRIYNTALTAAQVTADMNTPVAPTVDSTPPILSGLSPSGTLAVGTTQATLALTTSENASCRWSATAGTPYGSMGNTFSVTGGLSHSTVVGGLANGQSYTYYVRCADAANNANGSDSTITFAVAAPDTTAPSVSIGAPAAGATVSGSVTVSATASDNVGVAGVQFLLDGVALGAEVTAAPFTITWNTATASNGSHTLTARARDAAGNQTTSTGVAVTVSNAAPDTTAPVVAMSAPAAGASVSGSVTVSASASDNVGVAGVQFLLDGAALGAEVTTAPFSISWNTGSAANGSHSLTARARDAAGNQTTSTAVTVTVANTTPTGLVAGLPFSEGTGTTAADITGNGHTATLVNGPTWTTGQYGSGVSMDGVNDAISIGTPSTLDFGASNFTVEMWFKRNALGGSTQRHLFSKCHASAWQSGCKELYFAGNVLTFGSFATGDTTSVTVNDTNWHHIALVFTRATNTVQIYLDGTLRTTATKNLEADNSAHVVTIGNQGGANPFSGLIDEVRIYNTALTAAQVASDKATAVGSTPDTTPPVLSNSGPSGTLAYGTTQTALTVTTNEAANCRYSTTVGTAYSAMTGVFSTTGGTSHSTTLSGLANGQSYLYYLRCQDLSGNANAGDQLVSFSVAGDTTAPTVALSAPVGGATVSGAVSVTANASDNVGVVGVQFMLDGVALGAEDTTAPYAVTWTTTTASNGSHTLTARARDAAGNVTTSADVTVTVSNDTTAPTVALSTPGNGATVAGTTSVTASASDNVGVVGVQFLLDGVALGAEVTTAPYAVTWNTTTATNGSHTLSARARDAAGNQTTSGTVSVTVSNTVADTTAPTVALSAPATGATVSGTASVSANASDNVGVVGVQFLLDGNALGAEVTAAPYTVSWNTTTSANGSHTLTARARDAAGNQTTSSTVSVTVANAVPDTTAPTVAVSAPLAGATVSGTTTVSANASDNVGVVGVQFLLDGAALGAEVTSAPFTVAWNTAAASDGSHTLTARARDAAGNQTTSGAVSVTVSNGTIPNLVAGLPLNETSGTAAADVSGGGHGGTLVNGPAWVTGQYGNALSFDGVNDVLSLANPSTLNFGSADFTVMMWFKRASTGGSTQRHLFAKCNSTTWQVGCKELYFLGNVMYFGSFNTGDTRVMSVTDTNWHHVAVVFRRATNATQVYVDGTLRSTSTKNLEADNSAHVVTIGNMHGANPFSGLIDDVRVYSAPLTQAQVSAARAAGL